MTRLKWENLTPKRIGYILWFYAQYWKILLLSILSFLTFILQAENEVRDLIATYQQCENLRVETELDDLEITEYEVYDDSLEAWDSLDVTNDSLLDDSINE